MTPNEREAFIDLAKGIQELLDSLRAEPSTFIDYTKLECMAAARKLEEVLEREANLETLR